MKSIFPFFLFLLCLSTLTAQTTDTTFVSISEENGSLEKQQVLSSYDQVFGTMEPTKWMFTLNIPVYSGSQYDFIRAGAEFKLSPAFSLHGSYGVGFGYTPASSSRDGSQAVTQRFAIEPRWYYAMPRHIREGKSANNLSGNYFGLEAVHGVYKPTSRINGEKAVIQAYNTLALRYGVQRRLFRYGFLDLGFGIGVVKTQLSPYYAPPTREWNLFANSQVGLGLALSRPKNHTSAGGFCEVLRCFQEERQMWKVDLYNLLRINGLDDYRGQLSLAYERKISDWPLSVELQGEASHERIFTQARPGYYENTQTERLYSGGVQSRYYYTQSKRIATGKSGNNLSGVYVGAQVRYQEEYDNSHGFYTLNTGQVDFNSHTSYQKSSAGLLWGIQHRLFEHGFIDFNFVAFQEHVKEHYQIAGKPASVSTNNFNLALKLRAGLAF